MIVDGDWCRIFVYETTVMCFHFQYLFLFHCSFAPVNYRQFHGYFVSDWITKNIGQRRFSYIHPRLRNRFIKIGKCHKIAALIVEQSGNRALTEIFSFGLRAESVFFSRHELACGARNISSLCCSVQPLPRGFCKFNRFPWCSWWVRYSDSNIRFGIAHPSNPTQSHLQSSNHLEVLELIAYVTSVSVRFRSKERPRNDEERDFRFFAVFDSRSWFFAPKPHGNACYAGAIWQLGL